ncbi:MAG: DNA translocase FtsK 4TM domain-containing protein, partial [Actinomycetota bacterium]
MSDKGSRSSSPGSRGRSGVKTPPAGSRRPSSGQSSGGSGRQSGPGRKGAESQLAQVTKGREVEFWGIGLVSLGLLLVLSMYAHMAGPLGTGIDKMFGWLFGLGRFALPIVSIVIGVAMVRRRSVEHRVRLTVGWGINVLATLGFLHLVNGADKIVASVDAMSQAGGWFGAIIGEPLRTTVSWAGALVVLLAAGVLGTML